MSCELEGRELRSGTHGERSLNPSQPRNGAPETNTRMHDRLLFAVRTVEQCDGEPIVHPDGGMTRENPGGLGTHGTRLNTSLNNGEAYS